MASNKHQPVATSVAYSRSPGTLLWRDVAFGWSRRLYDVVMHAHDPIGKKMNKLKDHHKHTKKEERKKETSQSHGMKMGEPFQADPKF